MIAQLVRQDAAFRRLPFWVLMAMVWAGVAAGMSAWITANRGPISIEMLGVLSWTAVVLYLVFGEVRTRAHRFNLALPISAKELWIAHIVAVSLTGLVILAISAVVTGGSLILMGKLVDATPMEPQPLSILGGLLVAALLLGVAILHAFRPDTQEVPVSRSSVVWSLAAAAIPLGLLRALQPLGFGGVTIVLALAVTALAYGYRSIPDTFSVPTGIPRGGAATPSGAGAWETPRASAGLWFSLRVVHGLTTCAKKPIAALMIVPVMLLLGFVSSGVINDRGDDQRFAYPLMVVYVMMAITTFPLNRLGSIDWLPWSRRRTLALLVLPGFALFVAGYGAGVITEAFHSNAGGREALCFVKDRESSEPHFCVALRACEIAWSGNVPEITSPEGKTFTPWNKPVVEGLPARVYFPYDIPAGASQGFAASQISAAAAAIYGVDIPAADIASRYLKDVESGGVPKLTLQADYPDLRRRDGVYFPWITAFIVVFWALLTTGYVHWLRGGVSEGMRKVMGVVFLAIPMALWILDFVMEATGFSEIAVRNAFIMNLVQGASSSTAGVVTTWLVCAAATWSSYRLIERRVEGAELSTAPSCGIDT